MDRRDAAPHLRAFVWRHLVQHRSSLSSVATFSTSGLPCVCRISSRSLLLGAGGRGRLGVLGGGGSEDEGGRGSELLLLPEGSGTCGGVISRDVEGRGRRRSSTPARSRDPLNFDLFLAALPQKMLRTRRRNCRTSLASTTTMHRSREALCTSERRSSLGSDRLLLASLSNRLLEAILQAVLRPCRTSNISSDPGPEKKENEHLAVLTGLYCILPRCLRGTTWLARSTRDIQERKRTSTPKPSGETC